MTVSHAGAALLAETADRLGLTSALSSGLTTLRRRRTGHDPGRVVRDLAVMLADGGDALCDLRTLRDQPALFGPVASDATAWRVIDAVCEHGLLDAIGDARAAARERAFALGARPAGPLVIDLDATPGDGAFRQGRRGGHLQGRLPISSAAGLPGLPRAGGGRDAAGRPAAARQRWRQRRRRPHIAVLSDALAQLPRDVVEGEQIVMRTDSAGATHELLGFCRDGRIRYTVGFDLTEPVRQAILAVPDQAWKPAQDADGQPRENGHVAEITDQLDLSGWPEGSRVIVRRERPHPGAQLSFSDHDGHRFQAIFTDQPDGDIAALERRHRARARVEDRIRTAKDCGLANLPFRDLDANTVWLQLVLAAQDLLFATQTLCLDGELARCEPKRLRYRLLHCAGRLGFHARKAVLRLPRAWPWAGELAAAFARLGALPAR